LSFRGLAPFTTPGMNPAQRLNSVFENCRAGWGERAHAQTVSGVDPRGDRRRCCRSGRVRAVTAAWFVADAERVVRRGKHIDRGIDAGIRTGASRRRPLHAGVATAAGPDVATLLGLGTLLLGLAAAVRRAV